MSWDDESNGGWADPKPDDRYAQEQNRFKPAANPTKPTQQQMADFWNANRKDPAKVYEAMQQNGVTTKDVANLLGVSQDDVVGYLDIGQKDLTKDRKNSTENPLGWDQEMAPVLNYEQPKIVPQTRAEFDASIKPEMLDANGRFKGPSAGVHYSLEGLTPDQVWQSRTSPVQHYDDNTGRMETAVPKGESINVNWEPGYDSGGGWTGHVLRQIGNAGTAIAHNPPLMMAITAGIGDYMNAPPAAAEGASSTGSAAEGAEGASAGSGSGEAAHGGGSDWFGSSVGNWVGTNGKALLNTVAKTPGVVNGIIDYAQNHDLNHAVQTGVISNVGSKIGGVVGDATGSQGVGNIVGSAATSILSGRNPINALVSGGVNMGVRAITGNIDGFSSLPLDQQNAINGSVAAMISGKSPTQALIDQATSFAIGQVNSKKPKKGSATGGWAD